MRERSEKKVLITGATGFIGSHLVKRLVAMGYDVHAIIRNTSNIELLHENRDTIKIYYYDGLVKTMMEIMEKSKPDIVIHLATYFIGEHLSEDIDPLFFSNILFGTHLLEAMDKSNVAFIINAGTYWEHYSGEDYNPVNLYAATKKAFEDIGKYYTQSKPIRMITLKLSDTYGPNDNRSKIFSLLKKAANTGEVLKMTAGEQLMGLVYVDDVIDAFLCAMDYILNKPEHYQDNFFIFPDKLYSLREVVCIYESVCGTKLNIQWGAREYRFREVMKPYLGKKLPGWKAKTDLPKGLALLLNS